MASNLVGTVPGFRGDRERRAEPLTCNYNTANGDWDDNGMTHCNNNQTTSDDGHDGNDDDQNHDNDKDKDT